MAYVIEYDVNTVADYLSRIDLSREGRIVLYLNINSTLRDHGDEMRGNADRRLSPGSEFFTVSIVYNDPKRQVMHHTRLIVSDADVQYGVLRVVFIEDYAAPPW